MEKADHLRRVPIFCMLEPKILAILAEMTRTQHYHRGQIIYYRGDPGNAMYVLVDGSVELTLPSETGSEVLVARLRAGQHFGELAVLDGRPRWVTAVAAEPTQVLAIYREALLDFLRQHAEASLQIALSLCSRLRHIAELLSDMVFLDLLSRLAKRLCEMADILHEAVAEAKDVRITQEDLAEMVGATREAVNKHLGRLREMGVIQTGRKHVRILDPERLRAIALGNLSEFNFQT
ncbi:MAG TPA: Crp/Fnr family transcriptional regulator [archaeon]|nr:Crp/Fnr family transcriptional regulator [archaeon]